MRKLPKKSEISEILKEEKEEQDTKRPFEKPAKKVMKAVGQSLLKPPMKKKNPFKK